MKKAQLMVAVMFLTLSALAQGPVRLTYRAEKIDARTYAIHITANMASGWHIYSQDQPPKAISKPTKIRFNNSPLFVWGGKPVEKGEKETYEDKSTDVIQYQYGGTVEFTQTLTLKAPVKTTINGSITYQACTEEECQKPQTVPFTVSID